MSSIERFNIYQECYRAWGKTSQILMAIEELNELAVSLCHSLRANKPFNIIHITEEIADVQIMIEQLRYTLLISDIDLSEARHKKIEYLKELLKKEETLRNGGA